MLLMLIPMQSRQRQLHILPLSLSRPTDPRQVRLLVSADLAQVHVDEGRVAGPALTAGFVGETWLVIRVADRILGLVGRGEEIEDATGRLRDGWDVLGCAADAVVGVYHPGLGHGDDNDDQDDD